MSTPINPNSPKTNFDKISQDLDKTADSLKDSAAKQRAEAGAAVNSAGGHAVDAFVNVAGAGVNAVLATANLVGGLANTAASAGQVVAAGGMATVGVAGWASEEVRSGGRQASKGVARGFAAIANLMTRILGDGRTTSVRETQGDSNAVRFSKEMFGAAGELLQGSADSMNAAWGSYVQSIVHVAGSAVNLGLAAGNTLAVAGNLAKAAALTGSANAREMAEFGVRLSSASVQAAEQGVVGARELAILGARFSAATANVLANPDQGQVRVVVQNQLAAFKAELTTLQAKNAGLQPYVQSMLQAA